MATCYVWPQIRVESRGLIGPEGRKQLKTASKLGAVGLELGISIALGLLAGRWLDNKLGTTPYLAIAGLILGSMAGFRGLYLAVKKMRDKTQNPP